MRSVRLRTIIGRLLLGIMITGAYSGAQAEWYAGGYGGLSAPSSLTDATMNQLGQNQAQQQFPQANNSRDIDGRGTLTQSFNTSNLSLKDSPIFGIKGGYFFTEEKLPWLGVEIEAFTSTPTIKSQTLNTVQDITYQPNTPAPAAQCQPPAPPNCPAYVVNRSSLSIQQSDLRLVAAVFNVIARYPGTTFQPYAGVGGGGFYFSSSGQIDGRQVVPGFNAQLGLKVLATEEWGFFVEGKYNYATITNLDPSGFGLSGVYNAFNAVAGIAYHF